jgi:N-hydroxyarylamine O-acetyltransferase
MSAHLPVPETVAGYLSRIGLPPDLTPTTETLIELQRRHLDAVPYENLAIMLGRPDTTDPARTLARIAAGGNAGYCFHHNGAFEVVLRALGFAVERRPGRVRGRPIPALNHLVLLVTIDGRRWWPDLGLGDALRDPVEVVTGEIRQGPFRYEITDVDGEGWTFLHDPAAGSFAALDVRAGCPADAEVAAAHRVLSMPPDGRFTKVLIAGRRDDTGADVLRGIRFQRSGDGAFTRDLAAYDDWRTALKSLGVALADAADDELRSLHERMVAAHEEWLATSGR